MKSQELIKSLYLLKINKCYQVRNIEIQNFVMDPSYQQLNVYNQYLQSQVDKFTAFMVSQKKLNQKHLEIQSNLSSLFKKINRIQQKIMIIEVNQRDNLIQLKKINIDKQNFSTIEMRVGNIEKQLQNILKLESENQDMQQSYSEKHKYQVSQVSPTKKVNKNVTEYQNLKKIQKQIEGKFMKRNQIQQALNKIKEQFDFKLRKIQVETQKTKQSFLKLTSHINNNIPVLNSSSSHNNIDNLYKRTTNRTGTQSTRDFNNQNGQNPDMVTKKELKKMEKKLENFFSEKFSQIRTNNQINFMQRPDTERAIKFKRMQQNYDRQTLQNDPHKKQSQKLSKSERKIVNHSSQKKISIFDNQFLRQKQSKGAQKKQKKSSSKTLIQSPINFIQSPRNSKKLNKKKDFIDKKKSRQSVDRLKKVNMDYMMS